MMDKSQFHFVLLLSLALAVTQVTGLMAGNRDRNLHHLNRCQLKLQEDENNSVEKGLSSRRKAIAWFGINLLVGTAAAVLGASAAVTDETDNFGDNWWTAGDSPFVDEKPRTVTVPQPRATPSDEVTITLSKYQIKGGLGIELGEVEFRTNIRVFVKSVTPGSTAELLGIKKDWIVVGVNGQGAERTNAEGVAIMVSRAIRGDGDSIELRFRDPAVFRSTLENLTAKGEVTTQVAPAGDSTQRNQDGSVKAGRSVTEQTDQRLTVSQLIPPKMCNRGAQTDDLLEISYIGRVLETGAIFDGSAVKINGEGIAGRGNDVSIFFVLSKQPFGQFPSAWDVGLDGICVGERRRLIVPPSLAYGSKGLPRRGIPPDAALQYDVTLISLNGLAIPQ
jgi:FK506-binding protein 2